MAVENTNQGVRVRPTWRRRRVGEVDDTRHPVGDKLVTTRINYSSPWLAVRHVAMRGLLLSPSQ